MPVSRLFSLSFGGLLPRQSAPPDRLGKSIAGVSKIPCKDPRQVERRREEDEKKNKLVERLEDKIRKKPINHRLGDI